MEDTSVLDEIFRQLFSLLFSLSLSGVTHDWTHMHFKKNFIKVLETQLCFLFRIVSAPSGSPQMCQHRTGNRTRNNTALETIQVGTH